MPHSQKKKEEEEEEALFVTDHSKIMVDEEIILLKTVTGKLKGKNDFSIIMLLNNMFK